MDPTNNPTLKKATQLIQSGEKYQASVLLANFLKEYPNNEHAWHIMSYALVEAEQQIYALKRGIYINPDNRFIRERLQKLDPSAVENQPSRDLQSKTEAQQSSSSQPAASTSLLKKALAANHAGSTTLASPPGMQTQPTHAIVKEAIPDSPRPQQTTSKPERRAETFPAIDYSQTTSKFGLSQRIKTRVTINWRRFRLSWRIFSQSRLAILGVFLIILFGLMALAHPILMNTIWVRGIYDPATGFDVNVIPNPSPPVPGHILGTDSLGRDVLSMILAATTPTFVVGLTAALTTAVIGTVLSVTAAYFRGSTDTIITNIADVFLLFPAPIIMVIIGARFRDLTPLQLGLIYGFVTGSGGTTIVMRAQAIQIASKPFMEAAHIAGGGAWHIITKHLVPSVMPLAALQMMIAVTGAVVADGFISFFGLTRTVSNWGTIIYDAFVYGNISGDYGPPWHMLIPSAACFSLFALGFFLVSRGLHRVASPAVREEY